MFKKFYENIKNLINESESNILSKIRSSDSFNAKIYDKVRWLSEENKSLNTLQSQQRTIEQLTNALKDKYEHGLFIFSEDGKIPTVIRNGKELTNDLTTSFSIDWTIGEIPNINFEQLGGTYHDTKK